MTAQLAWADLLPELELYEPELGEALRNSPRLKTLAAGRAQLQAWEASSLTYLYGQANQAAAEGALRALQLPETLFNALMRREQSSRHNYYWTWDFNDRVESVWVAGAQMEIAFVAKRGPQRLRVTFPPLTDSQRERALEWLSLPETLLGLAEGRPLPPARLNQLVPAWEACEVAASARTREVLETGVQFLVRALVVHPVFLLITRGLGGDAALSRCVERELVRRRKEFEQASADLPPAPEAFWAAAPLPQVIAPHAAPADLVFGAHLPAADFWSRPEDNQLLAEVIGKVYKNIPRKLARLTAPRRFSY
mgnify:CR=1 FL=1